MRILTVNMSLDPVLGGGTAERTFQLSRHFASLGTDCTVLTAVTGMTPPRREALKGCRIVALPVISERFHVLKTKREEIAGLVAVADVIHLMNHWTILNALVYREARRLNKPYAICPAGALPIFGRSRLLKQAYNVWIGRDLVRLAQAHIAIASNEIEQFANYGVTSDRITIIPNGVNPGDYHNQDMESFRRRTGFGTAPYILFLGRLNPVKGPDLILKAFDRIASIPGDWHLVFAGPDGGMEASLKSMAARMGLNERTHFIGYVDGAVKAAAYHGASLVAIPSRQEAMSIVVLEAGICGKPVLMTDQCGFPALSEVGGGRIVAATEDGLADGLREMIHDAEVTRAMGERLRRHVERQYTWEGVAQKYLTLFEDVLHRFAASSSSTERC